MNRQDVEAPVETLIRTIARFVGQQDFASAQKELDDKLFVRTYAKALKAEHLYSLLPALHALVGHYCSLTEDRLFHPEQPYAQLIKQDAFKHLPLIEKINFYQAASQMLIKHQRYEDAVFYLAAAQACVDKPAAPAVQHELAGKADELALALAEIETLLILQYYSRCLQSQPLSALGAAQIESLILQGLALADGLRQCKQLHHHAALFTQLTPWLQSYQQAWVEWGMDSDLSAYSRATEILFPLAQHLQAHGQHQQANAYYTMLVQSLGLFEDKLAPDLVQHIQHISAKWTEFLALEPAPYVAQCLAYKNQLKTLRNNLQQALASNQPVIEAQRTYSQGVITLVEEIAAGIVKQLSEPPCVFTLIGMGSISRLELAPYSDIDFALLVEKAEAATHPYFKAFIELLQNHLHLLGDAWEHSGGTKQSLGLHLDTGDIHHLQTGELIKTPAGMAEWVTHVLMTTTSLKEAGSEKAILAYALQWPCLLYSTTSGNSDEALLSSYHTALKKCYQTECTEQRIPVYQRIAYISLSFHAKAFKEIQAQYAKLGASLDIKTHLLAPLTYGCLDAALYQGLLPEDSADKGYMTLTHVLEQLVNRRKLETAVSQAIKAGVSKLQQARIQRHFAASQKEEGLTNSSASHLLQTVVYPLLLPFYYCLPATELFIRAMPSKKAARRAVLIGRGGRDSQDDLLTALAMPTLAYNPFNTALEKLINKHQVHTKNTPLTHRWLAQCLLQGLAYTFVEEQAEAASFQQHYEQLPEVLRSLFLNGVEQAFKQHPHLPEPYARAVCDTLYRLPDTDGIRPQQAREQQQWRRALRSLVEKANDVDIEAMQAQETILLRVSSRNLEQSEQIHPECYVLKPEVAEQLVDAHQNFKPKPDGQPGRHTVLPIQHEGKLFWAKLLPEQPGTEYMVEQLAWRISGGGVPSSMLWKVHAKVPVAVQVTTGVPGLTTTDPKEVIKYTLEHALQKAPERLARISKKSFSQTLLRVLLTNPEDDKGDDYFLVPEGNQPNHNHATGSLTYRLWRIDNERAYYAPDNVEQGWISSTNKLQVKSALYCLDHMRQPLDREAIQDFLKLDPYALLESWLEDLKAQHEHYQHLFDVGDIVYHLKLTAPDENNQPKPMPSLLVLALGENLVKDLYNRLNSMQTVLRLAQKNSQPVTGLQLLEAVQPKLEAYYRAVFNLLPVQAQQPQRAYQRFKLVTQGLYHISRGYRQSNVQGLIAISQSLRLPPLNEELVKKIAKGEEHSPIQALAELQELNETRTLLIRHQLLAENVKEIQAGIKAFKNLSVRCQLVIIRDILQALDASQAYFAEEQLPNQINEEALKTKPTVKQQQVLLQAMAGIPFHQLTLSSISVLTDSLLLPILQGAGKHLLAISIKDCPQVTEGFLESLAEYCPALQQLTLIGLEQCQRLEKINLILSNETLEFAALTHLKLISLPELVIWQLEAPKLESLEIVNCPKVMQEMVEALITNARQIAEIKLHPTIGLTQAGLKKLISKMVTLQKLESFNSAPHIGALEGHTASVTALAVLPDGRIISGSKDTTLRLWDGKSFACAITLKGHASTVNALAVLPDGRLMSGSWDKTLRIWESKSFACIATLERHTDVVRALAKTLRIWEGKSFACAITLKGHTASVTALAVLLDGRVVSGSDDKTLCLWDTNSQQCLATLKGHTASVTALAVLLDGRVVSGSNDKTLCLWDTNSQQCLATLKGHTASVTALAVLLDGRVVSGSDDKTLCLWDTNSQQCLATLKGHTASVTALAVLLDGRVVSGSDDKTLCLWDVGIKKINLSLLREKMIQFTQKGKQLALNFTVQNQSFLPVVEGEIDRPGEKVSAQLTELINTYRDLISLCFGLNPDNTSLRQFSYFLTYTCQDAQQAAEIQAFLQQCWQNRQQTRSPTAASARAASPSASSAYSPFWARHQAEPLQQTESRLQMSVNRSHAQQ